MDAGIHDLVRSAFALCVADDIQALNFTGGVGYHTRWHFPPAQLGESHEPCALLVK